MVEINLAGLDGVLDLLHKLPPEIVSKNGGPVRSALRKGALVILKEEKANLVKVLSNEPRYSTGLLPQNVVVSRGKEVLGGRGERMLVRIRRKTYSGPNGRSLVSTHRTAQLLEYGSSHQPAEPWIRPAFNAKAAEAIKTVESDLVRRLDVLVKKLARAA